MQIIAFNRCWVIHWRWVCVVGISFAILMGLSFWQLQRAANKTEILQRLAQLDKAGSVTAQQIQGLSSAAADGLNVIAEARWLSPGVWLLDNQIVKGRIGYNVIVPMQLNDTTDVVLVNLGWVAATAKREELPHVDVPASLKIDGILRTRVGGIRLGQNFEDNGRWPMRIQQIDFEALSASLKQPLYPGIIYQLQNSPYLVHYQSVVMPPERHRAYALQWFLLALAVLVVGLAASAKKVTPQ